MLNSLKKLLAIQLFPSIFDGNLPNFEDAKSFHVSKETGQGGETADLALFLIFLACIVLAAGIYFGFIPLR